MQTAMQDVLDDPTATPDSKIAALKLLLKHRDTDSGSVANAACKSIVPAKAVVIGDANNDANNTAADENKTSGFTTQDHRKNLSSAVRDRISCLDLTQSMKEQPDQNLVNQIVNGLFDAYGEKCQYTLAKIRSIVATKISTAKSTINKGKLNTTIILHCVTSHRHKQFSTRLD